MYKTVRHGENSLQYTILPQTEEVLSNSGLKGRGRDYSPSVHVRRSHTRSVVKYTLIILFGIVVALSFASVPLYVLNGALYARRDSHEHGAHSAASYNTAGREIIRSRKKELKIFVETAMKSTVEPSTRAPTAAPVTTAAAATATTAGPAEPSTTPWVIPSLRVWKVTSTTPRPTTEDSGKIPLVGTPSGSVRLLDHYMSMKPWEGDIVVRPTATPEPVTIRNIMRYYSRAFKPLERVPPKSGRDLTTTTTTGRPVTEDTRTNEVAKMRDLKDAILSVDDDEDFKESLEVDEVFSLPPLQPEPADDEVTVAKSPAWYGARWPFVDTSSYFQWTGYSPGDNLLLPLLVAAMSSVALVMLLALAVRRRRRTSSAAAQLGTAADMQADDNTNLLTAENPEEAEE